MRTPAQLPFAHALDNRWLFVGIGTMILLQPGLTCPPWMGQILNSAPISLEAWGRVMLIAFVGYAPITTEPWRRLRYAGEHHAVLT
ncbi:cation transporting ATPase C-terminal domain-containing protein [Roseiflexus sp.]|uniref:cation transporting ATPase C-terminal domain-containing protein n=1 Tax=Roseiflexus sp. TaxID=2562120 RepID=UPI0021DBA4B3|nr:cation transporting ATPase C-terminal domain-containing protein [Roseiflexus sp.]GIW01711.1 MAG: hypothetical protein KatS3mg058_3114 [Roseiflexus sp.]